MNYENGNGILYACLYAYLNTRVYLNIFYLLHIAFIT